MLVNTAPQPQSGAGAAQALFQLADQGVCSSLSWEPPHWVGSRDRRAGREGMEGTVPLTGSQSQTAAVSPSCGAGALCATVTVGQGKPARAVWSWINSWVWVFLPVNTAVFNQV